MPGALKFWAESWPKTWGGSGPKRGADPSRNGGEPAAGGTLVGALKGPKICAKNSQPAGLLEGWFQALIFAWYMVLGIV